MFVMDIIKSQDYWEDFLLFCSWFRGLWVAGRAEPEFWQEPEGVQDSTGCCGPACWGSVDGHTMELQIWELERVYWGCSDNQSRIQWQVTPSTFHLLCPVQNHTHNVVSQPAIPSVLDTTKAGEADFRLITYE